MKIYFVRHGETDYNVARRIQGGMDTQLNARGIEQAKALGNKCLESSLKVDAIFSSPKKRAKKTAEIISKALCMPFETLVGLEEVNLGKWQGLTWSEVRVRYSVEFNEWYHKRRYTKVSSGESYQEMLTRVMEALKKVEEEGHNQVLIVTHSAVLMCILCLINDEPFEVMKKFKPDNGEIILIDSEELSIKWSVGE